MGWREQKQHMSHEKNPGPLLSIESWLFNDGILMSFGLWNNPYITG